MVVRYHLANQESADLLLYLFSSVSSLKSMLDEVSNGFVEDMEAMEAAMAASLLKLLRFVAKGLKLRKKINFTIFCETNRQNGRSSSLHL